MKPATAAYLVAVRSRLASDLLTYFEVLKGLPDREPPPYMGDRRLADLLADDADGVRRDAAEAIGRLGAAATPTFLSRLAEMLGDVREDVRRSAARAAGGLGAAAATPEILSRLAGLLGDERQRVREAAAEAMGRVMDRRLLVFESASGVWVA